MDVRIIVVASMLLYTTAQSTSQPLADARAYLNNSKLDILYQHHLNQLTQTYKKHRPLCICFSATPGMGKTFIAKIIEDRYQAIRISSDDTRELIKQVFGKKRIGPSRYLHHFLRTYFTSDFPNKCVVLDTNIDHRYTHIFPILDELNVPYIIIRLHVPLKEVLARIKQREGSLGNFLHRMGTWLAQYERFGKLFPDTIQFDNSKNKPPSSEFFEELERHIHHLYRKK